MVFILLFEIVIDFLYFVFFFFFFSSRRRHTRLQGDWSSDVCSSDLHAALALGRAALADSLLGRFDVLCPGCRGHYAAEAAAARRLGNAAAADSLAAHVRRLQPR